jgi:hypothetical protein
MMDENARCVAYAHLRKFIPITQCGIKAAFIILLNPKYISDLQTILK